MKFRFKTQPYQQEAVSNISKVFKGQPKLDMVKYTRDLGIKKKPEGQVQSSLFDAFEENDDGFENAKILLDETDILQNIKQPFMKEKHLIIQLLRHLKMVTVYMRHRMSRWFITFNIRLGKRLI